ncbi:MAG TPA: DUF1841 family protein [Steroidobacteraceae bacterium]|nr:DUF1841 family protein [Steroidobacteraceae bacterium]
MPFFENNSRSDLRTVYLGAWRKHQERLPLTPLEAQVVDVIGDHPEYQALFDDAQAALHADYSPDGGRENPFLHMATHLAIRDQVAIDRPSGIRPAFETLARRRSKLEAEHAMGELLMEFVWQAQRSGVPPDEQVYLRRVQKLIR